MSTNYSIQFKASLDPTSNATIKKEIENIGTQLQNALVIKANIDSVAALNQLASDYKSKVDYLSSSVKITPTIDSGYASAYDIIDARNKEHQATVKSLESQYISLKAKMYELAKVDITDGKEFDKLAKNAKSVLTDLTREFKSFGTVGQQELKNFESAFGSISNAAARTELAFLGADQIRNIEYYGDGLSTVNQRMIELSGTGNTTIQVTQQLFNDSWQTTATRTTDNMTAMQEKLKSVKNTLTLLNQQFGGSASSSSQFDEFNTRIKEMKLTSSDASTKLQDLVNDVSVFKTSLTQSAPTLTKYKSTLKTITDDTISLNLENAKGDLADKSRIITLEANITANKEKADALKNNITVTNDLTTAEKYEYAEGERQITQSKAQITLWEQEHSWLYNVASGFKEAAARVINYTVTYRLLWAAVSAFRDSIEIVEELNAAFTSIQMVTLSTSESISELADEYAELAIKMSATVTEVAEGADAWLRQGKSAEETATLIEASMVLAQNGAIEAADATSYLTAAINAYKLEAEDAMSVVDALSQVDVESASSVEDLAVALEKSASTASMAGLSFEKLIGYVATVKEVTQKSAETIGESKMSALEVV